jgi:hypothetical protein
MNVRAYLSHTSFYSDTVDYLTMRAYMRQKIFTTRQLVSVAASVHDMPTPNEILAVALGPDTVAECTP